MRKLLGVAVVATLLLTFISAFAALTDSGPFHPDEASAQSTRELSDLCANRYNGDLRDGIRGCASTETSIEIPDDYPFTMCANRYNGDLRYARFNRCASTEVSIQMPDAGIVPVCVNRYNLDLRYSRTGRCASTESSATIIGQHAPVATDDSYQAIVEEVTSRTSIDPDDLLDNDSLGLPDAQITSFGGGDAGGDVTTNSPGDSVAFAGGTLQINADGSFTLSNPDTTGTFTVDYRATNAAGSSDATVTFRIVEAPAAVGDGPYNALTGETFSLAADGLLINDQLGSPTATLTRFGVASADENDAGDSISLAGGTLTVNADGSLSLVNPSQTGNFIFWYRIANIVGESDAQVGITVETAPTAVDNGPYNMVVGGTLTVTTTSDHLLANDDLGEPDATITRFGLASADETDVGTTLTLAGGNLTVNADGSFSLDSPTQSGIFSFFYRLDNGTVPSDAEVTIHVNEPPDAVDDGPAADSVVGDDFHTDIDQPLVSSPDENLLANDDLGFPDATITFAGTLPQDGDTTGPGMTTAGGSVAVNADGSFTYTPPAGFVGEDTFFYELTNDGGSDIATVTIAVGDRPQANADDYGDTGATVLGNVSINTASSTSFSVLTNDAGDETSITAFDNTSGNGGDVTVNVDGTFTYNPAPGFEGVDSFTYTIDNGFNDPQTGTVSLTVDGMIWFVDASATTNGDGRIDSPFNCLVSSDCFSTTTADDAGDTIFLYDGTYTGGVTLLDDQLVIGQGASQSITDISGLSPPDDSPALPGTGGAQPILVSSVADALTLGANNGLHGFRIGNTGDGSGISGTNFGTLTINDFRFSGTGQTLDLANGTANVTLQSLVSSTSNADGLHLNNVGGSFTVNGATTITNASGDGIDLDTVSASVTFGSATINAVAGSGVRVVNNTGAIALNGGTIGNTDDPAGNAVDIDGGSASVTVAASVSKTTGGEVAEVTNRTSGTVTFSNALSCSSSCTGINVSNNSTGLTAITGAATVNTGIQTGVNLVNNGTHTVRFSGGLAITTTSGTGFNATGGGFVEVLNSGVTNTVTSTTGTAVNIQNTTIGAQDVTFESISASGATHGIRLNTTGNTGSFTVTGIGSTDGSGGTIQNIGQRGAEIINASNISLNNMDFTNANQANGAVSDGTSGGNENTDENGAIHLQSVTNVSLTNLDINGAVQHGINGNTVTNLDVTDSVIQNTGDAVWESGVYIFQLRGTQGAGQDNVFSNTTIRDTGQFNVFVRNNAATNAAGGAMDRLVFQNCAFADSGNSVPGDHVSVSNRNSANFQTVVDTCSFTAVAGQTSDSIQIDAGDSSRSDVQITGSTFSNGNLAINVSGSGTSVTTFDVSNNPGISANASSGVNVSVNGSSSMTGTINNNTISTTFATNNGFGIDVVVDQTGSAIVSASNNIITGYATGIRAGARNAGTGTAQITLIGNMVTAGGDFAFNGIHLFSGNGSASESNLVCVNLSGNTASSGSGGADDYFLEQYAGNTFQFQGLTPTSGATQAQVEAFVAGTDTGSPTVDAFGGTVVDYTAATCATP